MAVDPEELDHLVALFDDTDTFVTEQVDARLASYGPEIVRSLRNRAEREPDAATQALIVARARALNTEFKLADFQDFIGRETGPLSLFEGSWILSSLFDYTLQRERYEDLFFRCSQEYLAENSDQRTGVENIRILNHIFYHRLKFTLYDVQLQPCPEEELAVFQALKDRDRDLPDRATEPHWYDALLYPCSYNKAGKKLSQRFNRAAADYVDAFLGLLQKAPACDKAEKAQKIRGFAETLLEKGGPAVNTVAKLFGQETARRLILGHMYGVRD